MDFDEFVRSRSAALLRSAYLLTTDRHAAEDLLQEVLERVYVRWRRIRGEPKAYARRVLTNQAINRWRRRSRRVSEAPLHDGADAAATGDHAEAVATHRALLTALRELTGRQRAAVVLRYLDDLSEADTARDGLLGRRGEEPHLPRAGAALVGHTMHYVGVSDRDAPLPVRVHLPDGGWVVAAKGKALSYRDATGWHDAGHGAALLPDGATAVRVDDTTVPLR